MDPDKAHLRCPLCQHTFEEHGKHACLQRACHCGVSRFALESAYQEQPRYVLDADEAPDAAVKEPSVGAWSVECPVCGARTGEGCRGLPIGAMHAGRYARLAEYAAELEDTKPRTPKALEVQCPYCGAGEGKPCLSGAAKDTHEGFRLPLEHPHPARVKAYEDQQAAEAPTEKPSNSVTYHENTARTYLVMARRTARYNRQERIQFALKAVEHLIRASVSEGEQQ